MKNFLGSECENLVPQHNSVFFLRKKHDSEDLSSPCFNIRTQENYKTSASAIPFRKKQCRTRLLTLFNTGGRDLPAPRELESRFYSIFKNLEILGFWLLGWYRPARVARCPRKAAGRRGAAPTTPCDSLLPQKHPTMPQNTPGTRNCTGILFGGLEFFFLAEVYFLNKSETRSVKLTILPACLLGWWHQKKCPTDRKTVH